MVLIRVHLLLYYIQLCTIKYNNILQYNIRALVTREHFFLPSQRGILLMFFPYYRGRCGDRSGGKSVDVMVVSLTILKHNMYTRRCDAVTA